MIVILAGKTVKGNVTINVQDSDPAAEVISAAGPESPVSP